MSDDLNSAVNDIITQLKGNKQAVPATEDEILDCVSIIKKTLNSFS